MSGAIFGAFERAQSYTFPLVAVDGSGGTSIVERVLFKAVLAPLFTLAIAEGQSRVFSGPEFSGPGTTPEYIVQSAYRIAPLHLAFFTPLTEFSPFGTEFSPNPYVENYGQK